MTSWKMGNSTFTSQLDGLFSIWKNALHHMSFWVHMAHKYKAATIPGGGHTTFFNYHHFNEMTNIPDEIFWQGL